MARAPQKKMDGKVKSRSMPMTGPPTPVGPESSLAGQNVVPRAAGTRLECHCEALGGYGKQYLDIGTRWALACFNSNTR